MNGLIEHIKGLLMKSDPEGLVMLLIFGIPFMLISWFLTLLGILAILKGILRMLV